MNESNGSFCKFVLLVFVFVGCIVSGTSQLTEPSRATPGNGFSFLTNRHYMQIMDMLFTERRLRRHLEQNFTRLQNKIDSLTFSNKNQMTDAGIAKFLKPLTVRLEKQEQEILALYQMYSKNIKDKNNEVIKLKERVAQLEQLPSLGQRNAVTLKPEVVNNGFDAHKLQTIMKDVRDLKANDIARNEYLISLYKMTVTLKQDIDVMSFELEKFFNNSVLDKKLENIDKQFTELQYTVQNMTQQQKDSAITIRVGNLENKIIYLTNATLTGIQNDMERESAVDKRIEKLENSNKFGKTINGLTTRITTLEESLVSMDQSLQLSSTQLNTTMVKGSEFDKDITLIKDKISDIRSLISRQEIQQDDKYSTLASKTNKCKEEIKKLSSRQKTNLGKIQDIVKNITLLSKDKKHVGFTACGGSKIYDHINFEDTKTSYGVDMSISYRDGIFMVRDGGYYFVTASVLSGSQDGFYIWKNQQSLTSAWFHYSGSSNGYHSASASVFVKMVPGDKISIRGSSTSYIDPASCLTILKI